MPVYVNGELVLYGFVGDSLWREGFTSNEVLQALAEHGSDEDLSVRINSGGGYAFEGQAIYNALYAHKGKVTVYVDAIAASAASIIAMAGDEIVMRAGSEMMIHDPSGLTFGTADEHEKAKTALDKLGSQMASVYAARSEKKTDDVRQVMKDETWFTAEEAVASGYADKADVAKAKPVSAFDYRIYSNAPGHLVALSSDKGWSLSSAVSLNAASVAPTGQQETPMADQTGAKEKPSDTETVKAAAAADTKARIKEITSLDEAKGRGEMANHIAFETDMDVVAAKAMLAAAPKVPEASEQSQEQDGANPAAYEAERLRSSSQSMPGQKQPGAVASIDRGNIFASRAATMKGA
ncbi:head maturation protease, ClpP-related [Roseibium algae]|uniref:ATP-dependent Clp protease proteolytic subunit n=1 Tax=Roseibium algae TaxID=3123038 RepID=A0ABU8TKV6_9HYPH